MKQAENLLNSPENICKEPGMCDAIYVASKTSSRPHIVSKTKNGGLVCDKGCLVWKSQRVCSHTLALAEETSCLEKFLVWYHKLTL